MKSSTADDHFFGTLPKASLSEQANGYGRILVVEDDFWIKNVIAELLRREGYGVGCAEDGEEGWEILRSRPIDLLITDENMPKLRGLDLLRRVRRASLKIPVILISADLPWVDIDVSDLLTPGLAMPKPFSFPQLLANVRTFMTPRASAGEEADRQADSELNHFAMPLYQAS
jgi:DNA-binding response OmpR family regulator